MMDISVAEVEARSGVKKQPGETLAEYLRRVGSRTDLPADDVEAVIAELQRRQFAGGTATDDAEPPIEAFLEAADALGDDADDGTGTDGRADDDPDSAGAERTNDEEAAAGPAPSRSETTTGTDGGNDDRDEEDPLAFYRSIAVLGVVILLAAGVLGSALLLGTDLGLDDEPEAPTGADDLEDTDDEPAEGDGDDGNGVDEGDVDDATANEDDTDGIASDDTEADDGADDDGADDEGPSGDDDETDGTDEDADDAAGETDDMTGFGTDNGETADDGDDTDPIGFGDDADDATGDDEETDEPSADDTDDGLGDADDTNADDQDGPDDQGETSPDVVDGAPEATDALEVTDRAAPGDHPADEYVELTNVGDTALDMSGWTVRDREGGAVDIHGIEPLEIPEGYVLEPGESVRLVTGSGEDTAETIYWDHPRQNWRDAGDVVIVRDGGGEEVLRHPYGDQAP